MAGFSNQLEEFFLEWLFKQETAALATAPSAIWLSLHTADSDTGASEISGGSYARVQLNPDPDDTTNTNWSALGAGAGGAQRVSNAAVVTFPTATADWNTGNPITHVGLWSASTAGTFYGIASIASGGVVVLNGNTLSFPVGNIDFDLE